MRSFNSRPVVKQIRASNKRIDKKLTELESQIATNEKLITHIENRPTPHAVSCDVKVALSDLQNLRHKHKEIRDMRVRAIKHLKGPSHDTPSMMAKDAGARLVATLKALDDQRARIKVIAKRLGSGWRIGCQLPTRQQWNSLAKECGRLVLRLADAGLVEHVRASEHSRTSLYWPDAADERVAKNPNTHVEYYEVKSAPLEVYLWRVGYCEGAEPQARIHDQRACEQLDHIKSRMWHIRGNSDTDPELLGNVYRDLEQQQERHERGMLLRNFVRMSEFVEAHGMDPATSKFEHLSHFDTVKEHDLSDLQRTPDHTGLLARFPSFENAVAKHPTLFGYDSEWDKPVYFQGGAARWLEPSEIESRLFGGVYFITGDTVYTVPDHRALKLYTVRKVVKTGVDQIGGYRCFSDIDTAVDFISQCLGRSPHHCRVCCAEGVRSTPDTAACRVCKGTGIETISQG